ncbi:MAG: phosphoenolpyruvate synthase [Thermoplasmata archaeon]|nr:MAG: phosphoenolpyruvate synthase [Thermoplasmata archaeon]
MKTIVWAIEVDKKSIPQVGGKGANLGEMLNVNLPIPQAFIVTADAFDHFITTVGIKDEILKVLSDVKVDDEKSLTSASKSVREVVRAAKIPWNLEVDIVGAYKKLSEMAGDKETFVAVRSSATAEDLPEASFAGQQETYLNVHTKEDLLDKVRECWGSLYTPRAIFYREKQGFAHEDVKLAVVVQRMIHSDVSGVMFSSDPSTGAPEVLIEAGFGLGEAIVGGQITPDTYHISQDTLEITDKKVSKQTWMYTKNEEGNTIKLEVPGEYQMNQKLTDEQIRAVAELGVQIERHYNEPMDIEWCIEGGEIFIVQARPVTTIRETAKVKAKEEEEEEISELNVLTKGMPASPGIAIGTVTLIADETELDKVKEGDVLVTVMTTPDMVPAMRRANAIVTDEGGMTCHAAIVSRELQIPCIVGTTDATQILTEGMEVTVDADKGRVYEGLIKMKAEAKEEVKAGTTVASYVPITATKVYMNLAVPSLGGKYSKLPADGVGLFRIELALTEDIGEHPMNFVKEGREEEFVEKLAEAIRQVAQPMFPRPVVVRTSDFRTHEFRNLKGGDEFEPVEENPFIGWRGCSKYVSTYEPAFRLEIKALKKAREEFGLKNVNMMVPFVRLPSELIRINELLEEEGLKRNNDFKFWMMAEVPSNILMAKEFAEYCDGFSIGSNDLTMLVMGADRDSRILGNLGYFDERIPAVTRAIAMLVEAAHEKGKTVSICGQGPSVYPEFTEFLVKIGIDSISVNPDTVENTKRLVASVEQKMLLDRLRKLEDGI